MHQDLDRRFLLGGLAGAAGISALAAMAKGGGPLNPPPGAVTSTAKPLSEVEPRIPIGPEYLQSVSNILYRIITPGSYYLTGNITGEAGKYGIVIFTNNVTIDLNGFTVQGVAGSLDGITVAAGTRNGIAILNGKVQGWGASGISLFGGSRDNRIEGVVASGNATGIFIDTATLVSRCAVSGNSSVGITAQTGCTIDSCAASANGVGIAVATGCTVSNCTVLGNTGDGVTAITRNQLLNNLCQASGSAGIHLSGAGNRVEGNTVSTSLRGYQADVAQNVFLRNTSHGNTTHWQTVAGNFLHVIAPAPAPFTNGTTGGTPLAPGGYDPNANFTLG
jgi:parallel beta-helix repeat protein